MKKIVMIVTNRYDPDVRVHKEAVYLNSIGFEVDILCWDRENEYSNRGEETIDGVNVIRFFPFAKYGSGFRQIFAFIKFIFEVNRYLKNKQFDYLHCHDLDGIVTGVLVNKKKSKLIFDMHEFYEVLNRNQKYRYLVRQIVSFFQNKSNWIIYVNKAQVIKVSDKNKNKLVFLPNYPDLNNYDLKFKNTSEKLRISYIGAVRQYTELKNLMDACNNLNEVHVSIHGMGVAYENLEKIIGDYKNVTLSGVFDYKQSSKFYSNADLIYAVYPMNNIQNRLSYPVKFYEAILTNTPVIISKGSVLEQFLNEYDIGFVVDGSDKENIRKTINEILNDRDIIDTKKKNMKEIQFKYVWESIVKNLDNIYSNL